MKKEQFIESTMEFIDLDSMDIITASGGGFDGVEDIFPTTQQNTTNVSNK